MIEVELGSMVPAISNLQALPCPTAALWPQAVFDLDYGGLLYPLVRPEAMHCTSHMCANTGRQAYRLGSLHVLWAWPFCRISAQI